MTYHLVTTTASATSARTLRHLIISETGITGEVVIIRGDAVYIESARRVASDKIAHADALGRGYTAGYDRAMRDCDDAILAGRM